MSSAYISALAIEQSLGEREAFRRIGKDTKYLSENCTVEDLLQHIRTIAFELNSKEWREIALTRISWLVDLALQSSEQEKRAAQRAFSWAIAHEEPRYEEKILPFVQEMKVQEFLSELPTACYGRINYANVDFPTIVGLTSDLISRGYPLAAWDILATVNRDTRQACLDTLHSLGMREEDWILEENGEHHCILCEGKVVQGENDPYVHTSHCPITNLNFHREEWGKLQLEPPLHGLRKVPIVRN